MASRGRAGRVPAKILLLALASAAAAACGDGDHEEPASGEVVLYTSMPEAIVNRLEGVIEQAFPDVAGNYWIPPGGEGAGGISLQVTRGRTADIQRIIEEEIAAGGIEADVIWLAEPSPYETYKAMGLLAAYSPPSGAPIDPRYVDPDGFYVAGRVISMVVAWNTTLRSEALGDWADLATASPNAFPGPESGAARATIKALVDRYGEGYFTGLAAAGGVSVASNGAARNGLVDGTYEAVAVLDYMARQAREEGSPVDFVYPASGTLLIPSPIAITAAAANPAAAKVFVDYILSRSGQEIVVQIGSFYPVRSDVGPPTGAPSLAEINALDVDWKTLAGAMAEIGWLWDEVYGNG